VKNKLVSAQGAVDLICDGNTITTVGFTLMGASEDILREIEERFHQTGHPKNLTLFHAAGQCDRQNGIQHLAHPGLVTKIIGSHWGLAPLWGELIHRNGVEAYCLPQGQIVHLFRAMASGKPGNFTKIGLGTFIDPRIEGGKINDKAKMSHDNLVDIIHIYNEEYLFYKSIPIDIAIIRGTTADENGNITMEDEALKLEAISVAQAAKRFGGKVIAQVKNYARAGTLHPKQVVVPGIYVDALVISENPEQNHRLTSSCYHDPAYTGDIKVPEASIAPMEMNIRKIIGRRGVTELFPRAIVNLGTGIPGDTVGSIANEENILNEIVLTVESGVIGGIPDGGIDFGIAKNAEAVIEHGYQFDYYNGRGVDITYMGTAEVDIKGNVNVSRFGGKAVGCGGFIDITQPARKVVFVGTFTSKGLEAKVSNGKLVIVQEGQIKKFVNNVNQITFSGEYARNVGQKVLYVTERAVFELRQEGLTLIEYAPGIDIQKQIIDNMEFAPIVADDVRQMDSKIFKTQPMNFLDGFYSLNKKTPGRGELLA